MWWALRQLPDHGVAYTPVFRYGDVEIWAMRVGPWVSVVAVRAEDDGRTLRIDPPCLAFTAAGHVTATILADRLLDGP